MKILVLTKRQYTNKDLIDDRYGRLRELPLALAQNGHSVEGICLSYQTKKEEVVYDLIDEKSVVWHCSNLGIIKPFGFLKYQSKVLAIAKKFKPDIIWACSDSIYALLGVHLAKKVGCRCVIDLYDNFEFFDFAKIPGIIPLFKNAVKKADGVTTVSSPLAKHIQNDYKRTLPTEVLINGINSKLFISQDKQQCRTKFNLPYNVPIIGYTGAISKSRGIRLVFDGFQKLTKSFPNIQLVLAGQCDKNILIPKEKNIHYLGNLPLENIPPLINSFDLAIISNRDNLFGRYCFPQKFYEIMACRIPLIAAKIGAMEELLEKHPQCLFKPDDINSFISAATTQLQHPIVLNLSIPTWQELGSNLEKFLIKVKNS